MSCPRLRWILLATILSAMKVAGQQPTLVQLNPVAGQQGTTVAVELSGKPAPWPPKVWIDCAGVAFHPRAKAPICDVEIGKDAPAGPHAVRLFNEHGATSPRVFIVSTEPQIVEVEPNDLFTAPQKLPTLPATVNGRLDKPEDVDCYAVSLRAGQTLVAWLEAYVLGATFDGLLRVVDERGIEVAFNHDGRTMDPFLTWKVPADGVYIVQVMGFPYPANAAIQLAGGAGCIYRLHMTNGPFVHYTVPLFRSPGAQQSVKLVGWNLPPGGGSLADAQTETPIPVSDIPEAAESEPHAPLAIPGAVTGILSKAGEEDRYPFTVQKEHKYELRVDAASFGSPLDPWLQIETAAGKQLARSDDTADSRDPQLFWTAPADGTYAAAIGDVTHHGGADAFYRLSIREARPMLEAAVAVSEFAVVPGKTTPAKITLKRLNGFKTPLVLSAKFLPPGVSAAPVDVAENSTEATITLTAESDASAAAGPFELSLHRTDSNEEYPVLFWLTSKGETNGVPAGYTTLVLPTVRQLWLTVGK